MVEATAKPRVSAVILNWNGGDDLVQAVASLAAQTLAGVEVVVVDNGSTDGSLERLEATHAAVTVVRLGENTGFCAGNNRGLARARGDWVLFLNCDAWLDPRFLEHALAAVQGLDRVGFVAGKVLRADGRTIDTTGEFLSSTRRVVERGWGEADRGQYEVGGEIPAVCGAVALYRRSCIDDIARDGEFFDERFFAFWEDADVSWRARRRGWRGLYVPGAVAYHRRGGTGVEVRLLGRKLALLGRPEALAFHMVKNRYLMILKNEAAWELVLRLPLYLGYDLPRFLALAVLRPRVLWRVLGAWRLYRDAWRQRGSA